MCILETLFVKIGWVKTKDSHGFDVYYIPEGAVLNIKPTSWSSNAMDDHVFMDDISFEEDRINTVGTFSFKVEGNIHLGGLNCISPFVNAMISRRSTFIIFPKRTSQEKMIESILEVFPGKYPEEELKKKKFVCSSGNRKSREL